MEIRHHFMAGGQAERARRLAALHRKCLQLLRDGGRSGAQAPRGRRKGDADGSGLRPAER